MFGTAQESHKFSFDPPFVKAFERGVGRTFPERFPHRNPPFVKVLEEGLGEKLLSRRFSPKEKTFLERFLPRVSSPGKCLLPLIKDEKVSFFL